MDCEIRTAGALELLESLPPNSVDVVLTDPPFASYTHANARTLKGGDGPRAGIDFAAFDLADLRLYLGLAARAARGWVIVHTDLAWMTALQTRPPPGLWFIRHGVWVKPNGAPQMSGDRPAQGFEGICLLHRVRARGRMRWNGGGLPAVWHCHVEHTDPRWPRHSTQKPVALEAQLLREFSKQGDLVVDPFCGAGSVALAAVQLGRRVLAGDLDPKWAAVARERVAACGTEPAPAPLRPLRDDAGKTATAHAQG